ncbi:MAG: hypothetical protein CMF78_02645 [Candidatus Marinimicrobia bacterium]|nr:hypothetical protein [Candidatus Neomarinimicrobiota bacterium]|tara:strand:+ start:69 stop:1835 length:1767 start_codon:yes stop_codon:yes gene_type:complete
MEKGPEFDFSKEEDQKKIEGYRHEYQEKIKNAAYSEAAELKKLVESGEAKDYEEAEIKLAEKIQEEREETKNWIKNDSCDPEKIPEFLLDRYNPGEVLYLLREENKDYLYNELLKNDKDINEIVDSIDYTQEEGEIKTAPYGYDRGSTIQKKGKFLEITEEQREKVNKTIDELRQDDQRMALLFLGLDEKHPGKFGCGGGFGSFKNPSSCGGCVNGKVNLGAIFGEKIPYLKYKGDRCYDIEPFDNYKNPGYSEATPQGTIYHKTATDIEILALYGKEKSEQLLGNINKIKNDIEAVKAERKLNEDVMVLLGENYKDVKEKMPEAIDFLKEIGPSSLDLQDVDVKNKTLVFLGSRSEYGKSGGIAYFSRVIVWSNGQSQEKEYQWRDRWSASNDQPQYHFNKLEIQDVKKAKNSLNLKIEAIPGDKYSPTSVNFSFENITEKEKFEALSAEEQAEFKNLIEQEIEKIMSEKLKMWEKKPQMVATYPAGVTMPQGTPTYVNYERPDVTKKAVSLKTGLGAFVIKEQIDAVASDPQLRYEVYITKHNKGTKMAYEDHAYLKQEEDASITGLRISKGKVVFKTREGEQEIE